jgi:hypothetical protein
MAGSGMVVGLVLVLAARPGLARVGEGGGTKMDTRKCCQFTEVFVEVGVRQCFAQPWYTAVGFGPLVSRSIIPHLY